MAETAMPPEWQDWVNLNLNRGCDPVDIHQRLVDHGFNTQTIQQAMGAAFPVGRLSGDATTSSQDGLPSAFYKALTHPRLTQTDNGLTGVTRVDDDRIQLYTMDNCLTDDECDQLVALIRSHNRPSTITTQDKEADKLFRTSSTCDMSLLRNDFVLHIDSKIARILGINTAYSEGIQGQHYEVGQEFKAHTDYFAPGTQEYQIYANARGQRTWTFMIYLNDTEAGGATQFTRLDRAFQPKKGMAVIWNNLNPDGSINPWTIHWAHKVEKGTKTIITKWFREKSNEEVFLRPWTPT